MKKAIALILSLVMCVSLFTACGKQQGNTDDQETAKTLVVGTQNFDGKFSPFFYTNSYGVANCDIVENADGTVDYNITMKQGIKFSDGEEMTIDDVIFSYYVLLDPTYDGVSTLYSIPIKGLDAYRTGMDSRMNLILAAGPDGYTATDYFTEDQYNTFWAAFNAAGVKFAQEILDYVVAEGYAAATDLHHRCADRRVRPQRLRYRQDRRLLHDRYPDRGQRNRHLSDSRHHLPRALLRRDG